MNKTCTITKKCSVCLQVKHNLEFQSNSKGRTTLKSYCSTCKPIYKGVMQGLINPDVYIGLDYDTNKLKPTNHGYIVRLFEDGHHDKISIEYACRLVKQGAAYIVSENVIEMLIQKSINNQDLQVYVKERDKNICHYCDSSDGYTVDHIIPKWKGGLDTPLNLVCSCESCNQLKDRMSKTTFLRKKKLGQLKQKPTHVSWKEFKNIPETKKCVSCKKPRKKHYYKKQDIVCGKCKKFERAIALGFITVDELSTIHSGVNRIKDGIKYDLLSKDGKFIKRLDVQEAKRVAKSAIVHIDSKNETMQMLFDDAQLKRLYPTKTFSEIVSPNKSKTVTSIYTAYHLFDTDNQRLMTINSKMALTLVNLQLVRQANDKLHFLYPTQEIVRRIQDEKLIHSLGLTHELFSSNQIELFDEVSNSICKIPKDVALRLWRNHLVDKKNKDKLVLKSSDFKAKLPHYLLTGEEINVYNTDKTLYKKVSKFDAHHLIETNQANFYKKTNEIILKQKANHTIEPKSDYRMLTKKSYRLYSNQDLFIGHVKNEIAVRLVKKKWAILKNKTDINLTIPLSKARVKEPSLISI